jgi:hypothetical protein
MSSSAELIRWEARSHESIHHDVHRPEERRGSYTLDETVLVYKEISADLQEMRSRYESLVRRLMGGSAGASAEAAGASAGIVFRGLADAYELTSLAGAKRGWLSQLNEQLRRQMPEPVRAPETTSGFVGPGRAWLDPPDFESADTRRHSASERARELMRDYERATTALAGGETAKPSAFSARPGPLDRSIEGPTLPLTTAPHGDSVTPATRPDGARQVSDGARPGGTGGPPSTQLPTPPMSGNYSDFGPRGHLTEEQDTEGRAAGGALGSPPPPREHDLEAPSSRREDHDLFPSSGKASPPVIGV